MTSRTELAATALALVRREGAGALSMRRVAADLGVRAASLYWHVRDREDLLDLLADEVFRDVDLSVPDGGWRPALRALAHRYRDHLLAQGDVVRLLDGRYAAGPHGARAADAVLGVLRRAGLGREDAVAGLLVFTVYVPGSVLQQASPASAVAARGAPRETALAGIAGQLAALPDCDLPWLAECVDLVTWPDPDRRFAHGLELLLDGLEQRVAAAGSGGTSTT